MKKQNIILFTGGSSAYAPGRLLAESKKRRINLKVILYRNLRFDVSDKKLSIASSGKKLGEARGVFMRGLGEDHEYNPLKYAVLTYFKDQGAKVINSQSFERWPSLDKGVQHIEMQKVGIPHANSLIFGSPEEVYEYYSRHKEFPIIAKHYIGSCGIEVWKIEDIIGLKKFLKDYTKRTIKTILFQEFLPGASDLRVVYLDGKILGAMRRTAKKGSFLSNFSQGGEVAAFDLNGYGQIEEIVLKTAKHFLLDYGGIDLMMDGKGSWIVLEVNRACQFQGFEKATGINVADKIVEYLAK